MNHQKSGSGVGPKAPKGGITYLRTRSRSDKKKAQHALDLERRETEQMQLSRGSLYKKAEELLRMLKRHRRIHNFSPLLPLIFQLNGKPFNLDDYPMFEPFYATEIPRRIVAVTARQVAKSTNQAAQGLLMSLMIPGFHTMFVTPLFEQIRKFSTNYVHDFMATSPVSGLLLDRRSKNVLQRSMPNRATLFFSFALKDANRARGVPLDKLVVDESARIDTPVWTPYGNTRIQDLQPGDSVYAFDEFGNLCTDQVVACLDHGVRDCYRFELSDGSAVELTSDSFLATTDGWRRVSTVLEDLVRVADPDAAGNDAGGRQHFGSSRDDQAREPSLPEPTRLQATRVQPGEVPGIIRVRHTASQEEEELRLRDLVERLGQPKLSRAAPYRILVLPQGQETSHPDLARPADLGRRGVVVPGRREPGRDYSCVQHPGLFAPGSRTPGFLADAARYRSHCEADPKPAESRQTLLDRSADCGCDVQVRRTCTTLDCPVDAVQTAASGTPGSGDLSLVREHLPTPSHPVRLRPRAAPVLPVVGMSGETEATYCERLDGSEPREFEREPTCPVSLQSGGVPQTQQGESSPTSCCGSRKICPGKTSVPREEEGRTLSTPLDLPAVRADGTARRPNAQYPVLSNLPAAGDCGNARALPEAEIVRVTWTGKHRVFDIETRRHRTFFAGGVAVHNCQGLDPAVLPVLSAGMTGSRIGPLEQFTGTPLTYDNLAHKTIASSSWGEWVIPCSCGNWNIPSVDFDLEKMLGPYVPTHPASKDEPGLCCAKCGKPVYTQEGRWVHRYEHLRSSSLGMHIGQPILPLHCENEERWLLLQARRQGDYGYTRATFMNEICGEACDSSDRLLTETDLRKAAILGPNSMDAEHDLDRYVCRVLGVDWGGGGTRAQREIKSYTSLAVVGMLPDGKMEIIYGWRSPSPHDHNREVDEILKVIPRFRIQAIAHDYTAAGAVRETLLKNVGIPVGKLIPIAYAAFASGPLIKPVPYNELSMQRAHFRLDKARALPLMAELIRRGEIKYFQYDYISPVRPGLLHDWLSLIEDKIGVRAGNDAAYIIHDPVKGPDDFAQASTMGVMGSFQLMGRQPSIRMDSRMPTEDELHMMIGDEHVQQMIQELDMEEPPERTAQLPEGITILDGET